MKKLLSLALAAALALSLTGCGSSAPSTLFEMDRVLLSRLSSTDRSFTLTLDLDDPRALEGSTVYQSPQGRILLHSVTNFTPYGCDLTFTAKGVLEEDSATLVSAALPDPEAELVTIRKSPLSASPAELFSLDYKTVTPEFGETGSAFRLHLTVKDPQQTVGPEHRTCQLTVSNLLLTTWSGAKPQKP